MMAYAKPGLFNDNPVVNGPEIIWQLGINIRWRAGLMETIGLHTPVFDINRDPIVLSVGAAPYRKIYLSATQSEGQMIFGSVDTVAVVTPEATSTPATGTRWRVSDITPVGLLPAVDIVADPSFGRVEIPPVWWFDDDDDVVVGSRANVLNEPCHAWDRVVGGPFVPLANSPTGAVGGGILNRILILLGTTSFTDPDPQRFMTIRWSDRFNFEDWTPTDVNVSGELQLEGGSRIVGGGVTNFGVVAWTDKRMALLTENGDPNSVFTRRYIDGAKGMIANNAWCEADGRVWWISADRTLSVFDGGRPRQIVNPLKAATFENISPSDFARVYLVDNEEFGEIHMWFSSEDGGEPNTFLIYSYIMDCWSLGRFLRTAYTRRFGVIPSVGIDEVGQIYFHDIDAGIAAPFLSPAPGTTAAIGNLFPSIRALPTDVLPYSWTAQSGLTTTGDVTRSTMMGTRLMIDHIPLPSDTGQDDVIVATLNGHGEAVLNYDPASLTTDTRDIAQGTNSVDMRVSGKGIQLVLSGVDHTTAWRFGQIGLTEGEDGPR